MSTNQSHSSPVRSSSPVDLLQDDNPSSGTESGRTSQENDIGNFKTRSELNANIWVSTKDKFKYYLKRRQSSHPSSGVSLAEDRTDLKAKEEPKRRAPTIQRCGAFYENYSPPVREETPPHGIKVLVTAEDGTLVAFEEDREDQGFVLV